MDIALPLVLTAVLAYRIGCIIQQKRDNLTMVRMLGYPTKKKWWHRDAPSVTTTSAATEPRGETAEAGEPDHAVHTKPLFPSGQYL